MGVFSPKIGDAEILPSELVLELAAENRISAWTGLGALYGRAGVVKAARRAVRNILKPGVRRLAFLTPRSASRLNSFLSQIPRLRNGRIAKRARALDASLQLIAGRPSQVALPLAYWRSSTISPPGGDMDPARDGCGLIWYSPLVPMKPERVRRYVEMVNEICASHRMEPLITLTSLSDRCFDSSIPLLFDRSIAHQAAHAQACYRALFEAGQAKDFSRTRERARDGLDNPLG